MRLPCRLQKWIIPRGLFPMSLIAGAPWGWSNRISRIYEKALKRFHYRDVAWVAPTSETGYGLDQSTPIVNDQFLQYIREGSANYIRGQVTSGLSSCLYFSTLHLYSLLVLLVLFLFVRLQGLYLKESKFYRKAKVSR